MFVDLMADVYNTFTDRFLRMQIVYEETPRAPAMPEPQRRATKRYDAMGMLEDVPDEESGGGTVLDVAPGEPPAQEAVTRRDPLIVGGGRTRSLNAPPRQTGGDGAGPTDWSTVGRNDPCPCGSGKKFKKCHGANA
jgi:preprotein translocase subunit SecA